jgi:hypothetical protein
MIGKVKTGAGKVFQSPEKLHQTKSEVPGGKKQNLKLPTGFILE